jgi:membrane protein required for colicin V production
VTVLDYIVVTVTALSAIIGWRRGALRGTFAIGAALVGLVLASNFYAAAGVVLSGLTTTRRAADLLGFAVIFLLTLAAGALAAYRLRKALKRAKLSWLDRGAGAALGLLRAWLVCSALYMALTAFPIRIEAVERSAAAPVLVEGTRALAYLGSEEFRERFREGYDALQRLWHVTEENE